MNYSMQIEVKQKLKLNMTMSLQQSIKLLEMNNIDLSNYIYKKAIENPLIEIQSKKTELNIEKYIRNSNKTSSNHYERLLVDDKKESLFEHIRAQLNMLNLDKNLYTNILVLTDSLNKNGYLESDIEDVSRKYERSTKDLKEALKVLQKLDPKGLGGKNFIETLILQVDEDDLLKVLINNHIEDIYNKNYKKITRELKIDKKILQKKIDKLKKLNPKPAISYNLNDDIKFIIPDAKVEINGDIIEVIINDSILPDVKLSKYYKSYLKTDKKDEKTYIKTMKSEYDWLKNSLESRKNTLYNVLLEIVKIQHEYFLNGEKYLVSVKQKDIADKLHIAESTVSRIVNNKYIETDNGILKLKYFFYSGPSNLVSDKVIKSTIKEIIENENKKKPLSDNKIKEIMEERDIKIARRTVTKYRELLGIEGSTRRKEIC